MAAKPQTGDAVLERQKEKVEEPPMYNVLLLNDDYTPFDFVIELMSKVFNKTPEEAELITVQIHLEGQGLCGKYPKEIAEFKQTKALAMAAAAEHPLKCVIERETPAPRSGGPKM